MARATTERFRGDDNATTCDVRATLAEWGGGVLLGGLHEPPDEPGQCEMCAQEAIWLCRWTARHPEAVAEWTAWRPSEPVPESWSEMRNAWTDTLDDLPDVRPINDAPWSSDEVRTREMLRLHDALWPWANWTDEQRQAWASHLVIGIARDIISGLPNLSDGLRAQCRAVATLDDAADAAAWAVDVVAVAAKAAAPVWAWAAARNQPADDVLIRSIGLHEAATRYVEVSDG